MARSNPALLEDLFANRHVQARPGCIITSCAPVACGGVSFNIVR